MLPPAGATSSFPRSGEEGRNFSARPGESRKLTGDVLAGETGPGKQPEGAAVDRGSDQPSLQVVEEGWVTHEVTDRRPPVGKQPRVQPGQLADLAEDEHSHVDQQ